MTARFSELGPKVSTTGILRTAFQALGAASQGLEHGDIQVVSDTNAFRLGQQIFFWLGVYNPLNEDIAGDNWVTRLRLKPWWLRPNLEYRQPGSAGGATYLGIDQQTFLGTTQVNNRYCWVPSPKRLDVTEFALVVPPPVAEARTSDSLFLDDVWALDLQNANNAAYIASFPAPQVPSRWEAFFYPAMGYALGFTWDATWENQVHPELCRPQISLTYAVGTLGGTNWQESIG